MILPTTLLFAAAMAISQAPDDSTVADLVAAHNRERAERKLPPLASEPRLAEAARLHAADMAGRSAMTHEGADGSSPADRVRRAGYTYLTTGENVATGQGSVAAVMTSWMESPHHKDNILGDFTEIGVARAVGADGRPYWCVDFGRPFPRLDPSKAEAEAADRINRSRSDADKAPLRADLRLAVAARKIAQDLAARGSAKPDAESKEKDATPSPIDRIKQSGYRFASLSEGGSVGTPTPEALLKQLLESPDQKSALMGDFADLGVGYALAGDGRPFWCVVLGKPLR